jgi:hypothetical protein
MSLNKEVNLWTHLIELIILNALSSEGEEYLARGDIIQSSEKFYKVAEECIKLLSERFNLPEIKMVRREVYGQLHYSRKL